MRESIRVLLIEDDDEDAILVEHLLSRDFISKYDLTRVDSMEAGIDMLSRQAFDAVLLDLELPDSSGVGSVHRLLQGEAGVPVVVLSGVEDYELAMEAVRSGAEDFLVKGERDSVVPRAVRYAIERRRSAEEHRRLEQRLREVQRLESLGLLAGGVAHDFNNILTGILGNASLCLMEYPEVTDLEERLQDIERAAVRAADLCRQLLAYSGKGRFRVVHVDLSALVREMVEILRISVLERGTLECDLAADLPSFEGDETQVRQVVMNLITNATEALPGVGGKVRISTGVRICDEEYLSSPYAVSVPPAGDYVYIEVSDNGCGMDEEVQERLFEPFYSTKTRGRGLGLAAVLGIVHGHGGAVRLRSEEGGGTTLRVLFPAASGRVIGEAPVVPEVHYRGGGAGVLVVDDEPAVRSLARRALPRAGFLVFEASSGEEALAVLGGASDSRVRLVLLDVNMPGLSGDETLRRIRECYPEVKVILSSGFNEQEVVTKFANGPMCGFLQKPYTAQALLEIVRGALQESMSDQ